MTGAIIWPPAAVKVCGPRLQKVNRAAWLGHRRAGVGGSDAAGVVLGTGRPNRMEVWADKVHGTSLYEPTPDGDEAIDWGHIMEPVMAREWARREHIPGRLVRVGMLAHKQRPWQRVNLDFLVTDCGLGRGPCIVECKNRAEWVAKDWTQDEAPDGPAIQVHHGLIVTGFTHGHLLAVLGGNRLVSWLIDADPGLHETITTEESWFWHDHVLTGEPPPPDGSDRTGQILAQLWGADPDKFVQADAILAEQHAQLVFLRAQADELAADIATRTHQLQAVMADAEAITDPVTGRPLVTWKSNGTFRGKDFAIEHPELAETYRIPADRFDLTALAHDHPDLYQAYRSRSFLVKAPPTRENRST